MLILLATYNGARYLPELLSSIARQSFGQWRLLVRDDGSTDATLAILAEAARRDRRVTLLEDNQGRQGASQNFALLLRRAQDLGASYITLADQDDVWLPHKLARSLELMQRAEGQAGSETPLLVHADLSVVDAGLNVIHPSMTAYARVQRAPHDPLRTLLVYNFVTGCTAMLNRPLLDAALPIPTKAVMHDWWLALCAAATGQIYYLSEPVALYRQHAGNTVGVHGYWEILNPLSPYWRRRWRNAGAELARSIEQAGDLHRHLAFQSGRSPLRCRLVEDFCSLFDQRTTTAARCLGVWRLGIGPRQMLRQASLAARISRLPQPNLVGSDGTAELTLNRGNLLAGPHCRSVAARGERP
jgi:GT2 family glycosyltransferase